MLRLLTFHLTDPICDCDGLTITFTITSGYEIILACNGCGRKVCTPWKELKFVVACDNDRDPPKKKMRLKKSQLDADVIQLKRNGTD